MPEAVPAPELVRRRDEFLGILVVASGLLLLAALLSYRPDDPSLFSAVADPAAKPRNWAGRGRHWWRCGTLPGRPMPRWGA